MLLANEGWCFDFTFAMNCGASRLGLLLFFSLLLPRLLCFHIGNYLYFSVARFLLNIRTCVYFSIERSAGVLLFGATKVPKNALFKLSSQKGIVKEDLRGKILFAYSLRRLKFCKASFPLESAGGAGDNRKQMFARTFLLFSSPRPTARICAEF